MTEIEIELEKYTAEISERMMEFIEYFFTIENGLKEYPTNDDFGYEEMSWKFTQSGQLWYEVYLRRCQKLIERKFPNMQYEDLESYAGVIYP